MRKGLPLGEKCFLFGRFFSFLCSFQSVEVGMLRFGSLKIAYRAFDKSAIRVYTVGD